MELALSYSLFTPKDMLSNYRTWDEYRFDANRYWFNVPYVLFLNSISYSDVKIHLYISDDILNSPFNDVIGILKKYLDIDCEYINDSYNRIEPILWRHKALFEKKYNNVFIRDLDSLPTLWEYYNNLHFLRSDFAAHTMKTHPAHQHMLILGGLSGIKPNEIKLPYDYYSEYYLDSKRDEYNIDQNKLAYLIYSSQSEDFVKRKFATYSAVGFTNTDFNNFSNLQLNVNPNIIDFFDRKWAGCPDDFRGDRLIKLLNYNEIGINILNDIKNNDFLKNFYKV